MNPDDFNDPDVRALVILIPQEIAAAEARGRKQAADDIAAVMRAWSEETAHLGGSSNPAQGQCAVTAMTIQDRFGGEIIRGTVNGDSHYWNRLPDGIELDLTFSQFPADSKVANPTITPRAVLEMNPDTMRRYRLLRARAYAAGQDTG